VTFHQSKVVLSIAVFVFYFSTILVMFACFQHYILKHIPWPVVSNMPWKWLLHLGPSAWCLWEGKGRKTTSALLALSSTLIGWQGVLSGIKRHLIYVFHII
jgi:hypothetical protein